MSATRALQPYIRRIIASLALLWALFLYYWVAFSIPNEAVAYSFLMRYSALTGLFLLFVTLVPGLVRAYAPNLPITPLLITARKALGLSAFGFIALHVIIGFFHNLGGSLSAILYLPPINRGGLVLGTIAFIILSIMAITSINSIIRWLGSLRWKRIHRFVYLAILFAVTHALFLGSHFSRVLAPIPLMVLIATFIFTLLEVSATAHYLVRTESKRSEKTNQLYYTGLALIVGIVGFLIYQVIHSGSLGIHLQHGSPTTESRE